MAPAKIRLIWRPTSPQYPVKKLLLVFLFFIFAPLAASTARYFWLGDGRDNWQTADHSSAGLLPAATTHPDAVVRVFVARTVRWRSIFAVHTWIVVKEKGGATYSRYDYTAWGERIRSLPTDDGSATCLRPS